MLSVNASSDSADYDHDTLTVIVVKRLGKSRRRSQLSAATVFDFIELIIYVCTGCIVVGNRTPLK